MYHEWVFPRLSGQLGKLLHFNSSNRGDSFETHVEARRAIFSYIEIAYSDPNWTRNPTESGQPIRSKLDSESGANWTLLE